MLLDVVLHWRSLERALGNAKCINDRPGPRLPRRCAMSATPQLMRPKIWANRLISARICRCSESLVLSLHEPPSRCPALCAPPSCETIIRPTNTFQPNECLRKLYPRQSEVFTLFLALCSLYIAPRKTQHFHVVLSRVRTALRSIPFVD